MGDRDLMRASDDDRQQVVDRLQAALEEGRLKMEEFTDRIGLAYQAVTYGDLAKLHADLPPANPQAQPRTAPAPTTQPAEAGRRPAVGRRPTHASGPDHPSRASVLVSHAANPHHTNTGHHATAVPCSAVRQATGGM